jgi:hypothetical protein
VHTEWIEYVVATVSIETRSGHFFDNVGKQSESGVRVLVFLPGLPWSEVLICIVELSPADKILA